MSRAQPGDLVHFNNEEGWTRLDYREKPFVSGRQYVLIEYHTTESTDIIKVFGQPDVVKIALPDKWGSHCWFPQRLIRAIELPDLPERSISLQRRRMRP